MTPPRDKDLLGRVRGDVEAIRRELRDAPVVPVPGAPERVVVAPQAAAGGGVEGPELVRRLAGDNALLDVLRRRVRQHELDPDREARCEQAALDWLNAVAGARQLLDELVPDPAFPRPALLDLRTAASILRLRDRRPGGQFATLADVRAVRTVTDAFYAAILNTGCALAAPAAAPTYDTGVLLPLRIETRFDVATKTVRIRVFPDEPWLPRHDPQASDGELTMLEHYLESTSTTAWSELVTQVGGPRAVWLVRTFVVDDGGHPVVKRPPPEALRTEPTFPDIAGLPEELHVYVVPTGGAAAIDVLTLTVDPARLRMSLPDLSDPADVRWFSDWKEAVEAGLAGTFELPVPPDEIDVLYVVGIGDGDPAELFRGHRDAGVLGLLAPGTPTNSVDGAPAASLGTPEEWWDVLQAPASEVERSVSYALTGQPDLLGRLPGPDEPHEAWNQTIVTALWPALFGFAADDVWGLRDVDAAFAWARHALFPEGPFPTVRVGAQPYGLLPATAPEAWVADAADPAVEARLLGAVGRLLPLWVEAAEARGTVADAPIDKLLDLLGDTPTADVYRHRPAIALELWWLILALSGFPIPWADFEAAWQAQYPVASTLGVSPARRYGAIGTPARVTIPLVRPAKAGDGEVAERLKRLVELAQTVPRLFASFENLERELFRAGQLDSVLLRLAARAIQVALGNVGRELLGEKPPQPEPLSRSAGTPDNLARWIAKVTPAALAAGTPATEAFARVADAVVALGDVPEERLERLLRATLDTASHRIDPWLTGAPARRLADVLDSGRAKLRLGAYGWVDAPRPGAPGPTAAGLLHAPSAPQALTASVLRDRALNDADAARWHMDMTSRTVRDANRIADHLRVGAHFAEALGREVERVVATRADVDRLRARFPLRTEHEGRRTCDGQALLAADPTTLGLPAAALAGLDQLRAGLDAFGDLFVAEAAHDVLQRRPAAAAAALDAAAGLSRPPDLAVLRTDRLGRSVATAAALVLAPADTPELPVDAELRAELSPAVLADPAAAAFIAAQLGAAAAWTWVVANPAGDSRTVALDTLGLEPADALTLPRGDLERLVLEAADLAEGTLSDATGSDKYEAAARLVALVGARPADAGAITTGDPDAASASSAAAVDADLAARYTQVRDTAVGLSGLLDAELALTTPSGGIGTADPARLTRFLGAARRWGIAPDPPEDAPDLVVAAALRAHELLAQRLKAAPAAAGLTRDDLVAALVALVAPTAQLAVLSRLRFDLLPALAETPAIDDDWLPVTAAVREPLARVEAHQLAGTDGPGLTPWSTKADVWQLDAAHPERLVAIWSAAGVQLDAAAPDLLLPVAAIDTFAETIPEPGQATAAAFGFDGPAARPVQALLLAVPPDLSRPLDAETTLAVVAGVRRLGHARMARPRDLGPAARQLLPTTLVPASGPNRVPFDPTGP